jgi:hypothetical protein
MARTITAVINGTSYEMPASFGAAKEIGKKVGDPLKLAVSAARSGGMVPLSIEDVVRIIAIGCSHAGCKLPEDVVGEYIVEQGVTGYLEIVGEYITAIVSGADPGPKPTPAAAEAGSK